jgi:phosphohistidine phosphatase
VAGKPKQLLLMRHAKSDWEAAANSDFERPLNPRGRHDAPRMGGWLQTQDMIPDLVLTSPARRANQTAQAVMEILGLDEARLQLVDEMYLASRATLLDVLATKLSAADSVLLVAHNPGLDDLVAWLADTPPPLSASGKLMTTAAIAWFELSGGSAKPGPDTASLKQLVRPADLVSQAGN